MANFDNFDNYEQFEKDINSWTNLGIIIKTHKVKAYCKQKMDMGCSKKIL
jgi:hypothetical protein